MSPASSSTYTIAHRGLPSRAPENTMPAFEAALAAGASVLELDVRATSDCVLVCAHDVTLARCHGDERRVGQLTHEELVGLAPDIPTLAEVLATFGDSCGWFIDCKVKRPRAIGELERVVHDAGVSWDSGRELRAGAPLRAGTACFESRDADLIQSFGARNKAGCVELVSEDSSAMELTLGAPFLTAYAQGVVVPDRLASSRMLRLLGALKLGTYVYTINERSRFDELRNAGASGVFTDVCDEGW